MADHRLLYFKIEKLDSSEAVIEDKVLKLNGGKIDVGSGGSRRKAAFDLLEALPADWQAYRWKPYYGYATRPGQQPTYVPLGVYIPINPSEKEQNSGYITSLQGVDKTKLFSDYEIDQPVTFANGTTVRSIIQTIAGWFSESKLTLDTDLGTLGAALTFEEGTTAESILNTICSSFSDEWFYNADGYLIARKQTDPATRPVRYVMDDPDEPLYIDSSQDIDDGNYYNRVTVVGGLADTPIYRRTYQNDAAIAAAGNRIVQRYFTVDAAVTQAQVDGRAAYYLSNGVLLPRQLKLTNLVLPDLELGDIVQKNGVRYEVRAFSVPLGLGSQDITAGEIVE